MRSVLLHLVLCICIFTSSAGAQSNVGYFRDAGKQLPLSVIANKNFRPLPNKLISFGKDSANHWLRIHVKNNKAHFEKYFFEIDFVWLDSVCFYKQDLTLVKALSWQTPFAERLYPHQNFILPILLKPYSDTTIYTRLYKKRMLIKGDASVKNEETFFSDHIFDTSFYSFFTGIVAIVFMFAMAIFFTNKDWVYLYYAFYIIFSLGFTLTASGFFLPLYQKGFGFVSGGELRNWLLWFSLVFLLLFIRNYILGGHVFNRINLIIWKITVGLMLALVFQRLAIIYFEETIGIAPYLLLVAMICCFLLIIVLSFYFVVFSYFKNINPLLAKNYLIGITPLFVFGVLSYFRTFEFIGHTWLLNQQVQVICVVFDIVVLMFGLSIRYRALREEKEKQARLALENKLALQYEKERISRDLHDSVGSQLTIVATSLDAATYLAYKQKLEPQKLEKINENIREAVQSLRDTIWATHQSKISLDDFDKRLRNYALKVIEDKLKVAIHFTVPDADVYISSMQAINLFRVIQEAIQNVLKHAQATQLEIRCTQIEGKIKLSITDNGIGMPTDSLKNTDTYGIKNMHSRINEIKGTLNIESVAGEGTKICIEIPIYAANALLKE